MCRTPPPFSPAENVPCAETADAYDLILTTGDYSLTSTLFSYWTAGLFSGIVREIGGKPLNTKEMELVIPAFYQKYPNQAFAVSIDALTYPTVLNFPTGVSTSIMFGLAFTPSGASSSAFTLAMSLRGNMTVSVVDASRLSAQISGQPDVSWSVQSTNIGPIDLTLIEHITLAYEGIHHPVQKK